jgi:hypothetical protein
MAQAIQAPSTIPPSPRDELHERPLRLDDAAMNAAADKLREEILALIREHNDVAVQLALVEVILITLRKTEPTVADAKSRMSQIHRLVMSALDG